MNNIITLIFLLLCISGCNKSKLEISQNYYEKGEKQEKLRHLDSAAIFYRKAIESLEGIREPEQTGKIYNQLGDLFLDADLYKNAEEAFDNALRYNSTLIDKTALSYSLRGKGKSFDYRFLPDSGLYYFLKAFELYDKITDAKEQMLIHDNISAAYYGLKKFDKALFHNGIALSLSKDSSDLFRGWYARADILVKYERNDSAWYYYKLSSKSNAIFTKAGSYLAMSRLASKLQLADSSKYLKCFSVLKDSIERSDQSKLVQSIDHEYLQNEKIKKERNKLQTQHLIVLLLSSLLFIYLIRKYKRKLLKEKIRLKDKHEKIINLNNEMNVLQIELTSKNEYEEEIIEGAKKYEKLEETQRNLMKDMIEIANSCATNFFRNINYQPIKWKLKKDPSSLTNEEKNYIINAIEEIYKPIIERLTLFMDMVPDDCLVCCLALSKFTTKEISYLKGVSWDAVRSQKTRIKKKNTEKLNSLELFEFLFKKPNEK